MTYKVYTREEIREKLEPIFRATPIERAVLFGSYAKGLQTPYSDVDIMIDSKGKIRGIEFFGILEDITLCLEKQIDLIERYEIQMNSSIHQAIEREGVILYDRQR